MSEEQNWSYKDGKPGEKRPKVMDYAPESELQKSFRIALRFLTTDSSNHFKLQSTEEIVSFIEEQLTRVDAHHLVDTSHIGFFRFLHNLEAIRTEIQFLYESSQNGYLNKLLMKKVSNMTGFEYLRLLELAAPKKN